MHRIVISLTTIASRIGHLHSVVESLLAQQFSKQAYRVEVNLSSEPYLLDKGCPDLPPSLTRLRDRESERFTISYGPNIGPYRKILPLLDRLYKLPQKEFLRSLIVTADDDTIYPPHWLDALYTHYREQRCVVGFRGRAMGFENAQPTSYRTWQRKIDKNPGLENVLTGKDGILYSPLHLHPRVRDRVAARHHAEKADDLWLKTHALLLRVPSFVIHQSLESEFPSVSASEPDISLYRVFNERGGNNEAVRGIEKYLEGTFGTSLHQLCSGRARAAQLGLDRFWPEQEAANVGCH